jgi:splicing factor 3A subunit 1
MVTELPVPMTVQQMEARSLAEKRMAAMVIDDTAEEFERAKEATAAQAAAALAAQKESSTEVAAALERKREEQAREEQRARELAKNLEGAGPMKIRNDYVPKSEFALLLWRKFTYV